MNPSKHTEIIILILLWVLSGATFTWAVAGNYNLFVSDYIGIAGLVVVSAIFAFKHSIKTEALLVLLALGTFNLASFVYFFNVVISFGFGTIVSPGIQILSLVLLVVLILARTGKVKEMVSFFYGKEE